MKKLFLILPLCAAFLWAADKADKGYELFPTISVVKPESNTDLKTYLSLGIRVAQYVSDEYVWVDKLEFGFDFTKTDYKDMGPGKSERQVLIGRYYVDGVKEFELGNNFALYAIAGLGWENVQKKARYRNNDSLFITYGAGLKVAFTCKWALRAEVRDHIKTSHSSGDHNLFGTVGVAYTFGETPVCDSKRAGTYQIDAE